MPCRSVSCYTLPFDCCLRRRRRRRSHIRRRRQQCLSECLIILLLCSVLRAPEPSEVQNAFQYMMHDFHIAHLI